MRQNLLNEPSPSSAQATPANKESTQKIVEYSPFNPKLDLLCPIGTMFSEENHAAIKEGLPPMTWVSLLRNSPTDNFEAETIMGAVVTAGVRIGSWIDIPLIRGTSVPGFYNFSEGEKRLTDMGWAEILQNDQAQYVLRPKEPMIKFLQERLKQFGPKTETEGVSEPS